MVDLKKEIKLSDLKPKMKRRAGRGTVSTSTRIRAKRELVGLKIGASQLAAAHVFNEGGHARLLQVARQPLEQGVVVGGEVRDVAALGRALDEFFEASGMPRKNVRLGIGTNRIGVRLVEVDGIEDESQLANAVTFRAHEALSIPMEHAVLDYHVVEGGDDDGRSRRVVVAAAYRDPIDQLVNACNIAGIELVGIDVEAFALLRAVQNDRRSVSSEPTALIAVAIGYDRSTLATSDGSVCDFTRVLAWGGSKIDGAISRELGVTDDEAAQLKQYVSLSSGSTPPTGGDVTDRDVERARGAVERELANLARELVASLQFYQAQPSSHSIDEILITGGATRMQGFAEELERLIRARVRVADPLSAVQPVKPELASRDDLSSLAVAIGLGVEV